MEQDPTVVVVRPSSKVCFDLSRSPSDTPLDNITEKSIPAAISVLNLKSQNIHREEELGKLLKMAVFGCQKMGLRMPKS